MRLALALPQGPDPLAGKGKARVGNREGKEGHEWLEKRGKGRGGMGRGREGKGEGGSGKGREGIGKGGGRGRLGYLSSS